MIQIPEYSRQKDLATTAHGKFEQTTGINKTNNMLLKHKVHSRSHCIYFQKLLYHSSCDTIWCLISNTKQISCQYQIFIIKAKFRTHHGHFGISSAGAPSGGRVQYFHQFTVPNFLSFFPISFFSLILCNVTFCACVWCRDV